MTETNTPYIAATRKLLGEGFVFDAKTCFYERGVERLKLRWNGKVYSRRRGPPKAPDLGQEGDDPSAAADPGEADWGR
jgi:hypothetical protein